MKKRRKNEVSARRF